MEQDNGIVEIGGKIFFSLLFLNFSSYFGNAITTFHTFFFHPIFGNVIVTIVKNLYPYFDNDITTTKGSPFFFFSQFRQHLILIPSPSVVFSYYFIYFSFYAKLYNSLLLLKKKKNNSVRLRFLTCACHSMSIFCSLNFQALLERPNLV